jgi:hypothetical protein
MVGIMKQILLVEVDDEDIRIKIDGENVDLLDSMAHVIRRISENGLTTEFCLEYIEKSLEVKND